MPGPDGSAPLQLFAGVDLDVLAGEWLSVMGRSGVGKSALLEIAGLLRRPDGGTVELDGTAVDWSEPNAVARRRGASVGFVFQTPALDESASVHENVLDGMRFARLSIDDSIIDRVRALSDEIGLGSVLHRRVDGLSGGEKQRVSLLRAIVKRPSLLVADEPTANLDASSGAAVTALLRSAAERGAAVMVVTHQADFASASDRRFRLDGGSLVSCDERGGPGEKSP